MIYEKISIDNKRRQILNNFHWDYENKRIMASFYLCHDILEDIFNFNNILVVSNIGGDCEIKNAKIEKIKISNSRWGEKWVPPEITIVFNYLTDNDIRFFDFDCFEDDYRYLYNQNKFALFLSMNDYQIKFEDFDIYLSKSESLFPFEFYIANNFKDYEEMNSIYNQCIYGENYKIILVSETMSDFFIIEKECNLDFIYKNHPTDNYKGYNNNIVIYGGHNNSELNIKDNENSFLYNPLSEHLKDVINDDKLVKNNRGSLRIEL